MDRHYLISGNLLKYKKAIDDRITSKKTALKVFYIRRAFRIFPLYFFVIFSLCVLNCQVFGGDIYWYIFHLSNLLIFNTKAWPGMLSHFWSLSVEEQFYLVWPLMMLMIKNNRLPVLFYTSICLSLIFRFIMKETGITFFEVLPFSCLDAFSIGALLASSETKAFNLEEKNKQVKIILLISIVLAVAVFQLEHLSFLFGLFLSIASVCTIILSIYSNHGFLGKVLNFRVFQYLGKISYGLYVYHNFIPWLLRGVMGKETRHPINFRIEMINSNMSPVIMILIECILLIVISSISWFLLEKPMNNLKNKVAYA